VLGESPASAIGRREQIIATVRELHARGETITSGRVAKAIGVAGSTVRYHFTDLRALVE